MAEKLTVGPINKGLKTNPLAFYIDNDAFPTLLNAYQWRGRVKRKRGTTFLTRLRREFDSGSDTVTVDALTDEANLISGFSLQENATIVPGTVTLTDTTTLTVYTDPAEDGTLSPSGTINYSSGVVTIAAAAGNMLTAVFDYYPTLPVMGLRSLNLESLEFLETVAFDTTYSYNIPTGQPYTAYSTSFYKNPLTGTYTGYTQKSSNTDISWNGQDYRQFFTTNFREAFWATNGLDVPFTQAGANIEMPYKLIISTTIVAGGPPAEATLNIAAHGLEVGDFLFINEVPLPTTGINFQTGYVTTVTDPNNVIVTFPNATIANNSTGGIAQYLTNRPDPTKDCLRWYDGDPTLFPKGWVNFCPPLSFGDYSINQVDQDQYYLVGAKLVIPFKGRLLFIGPVIQTSSVDSQLYLQDTVVFCLRESPFYTASFTGDIFSPKTIFNPILVPDNETAFPPGWFEDVVGYGDAVSAGYVQPIISVAPNHDALIMGFGSRQTKLLYTNNDLSPFEFYVVNSELGTESTFSSILFDEGVLSVGSRGIISANQNGANRIDLDIPDQVFQINLIDNGAERTTAARDYINEWVYLTYNDNSVPYDFPTQTLLYNYRDNTWAIFKECYTSYGQFHRSTGETWATLPASRTWENWTTPWNAGGSTLLQPEVIGGNQQGYVLAREESTNEGVSLSIKNISFPATITGATQANPCVLTCTSQFIVGQNVTISDVGGMTELNGNTYEILAVTTTTVTINVDSSLFTLYTTGGTATPGETIYCPDHCLNEGDFIVIRNCLGTISASVNNKIFIVDRPTEDGFNTAGNPFPTSGTYLGNGAITRMYVPLIQTKQFPVAWSMGKKTRIGAQQYLLTKTSNASITLYIFLSEDSSNPYNRGPIVPDEDSINDSLIYTTDLPTSPELYIQKVIGGNLGSLGDGVVTTIELSYQNIFSFNLPLVIGTVSVTVGSVATFTDAGDGTFNVTGTGSSGTIDYDAAVITLIFSVAPDDEVSSTNFEYYVNNIQTPTAISQQQIWHKNNTSLIGDTVQLGFTLDREQMLDENFTHQFAEIELHGFVMEVSPSQSLV
jgi:hypothetical protein